MDIQLMPYAPSEITILRAKISDSRSQGDGEEQTNIQTSESKSLKAIDLPENDSQISPISLELKTPVIESLARKLNKVSLFTSPDSVILASIPKEIFKEKVVLKPVMSQNIWNKTSRFTKETSTKKKEPKFIPYEPYKGCVNPIVKPGMAKPKVNKMNSELQSNSVNFISLNKNSQLIESNTNDKIPGMIADFEKEKLKWEKENNDLLKENEVLKLNLDKLQREMTTINQQLSVQSQVNTELKKLLVASVGEDVQGRVQCLTEDKARMATMIKKYSEKVDKDFEEKEKISIQCDVWRSKFLASSLLLNDLAQWKGLLFQRMKEATEAIKLLLEERNLSHPYLINIYKFIHQIQEAFDPLHAESSSHCTLESSDLVSLSVTLATMAEAVRDRLLGTLGRAVGPSNLKFPDETRTPGEKIALKVLDECCDLNKIKGTISGPAERSSLVQRYHPNVRYEHLTVNCCGHCNGDIKVV